MNKNKTTKGLRTMRLIDADKITSGEIAKYLGRGYEFCTHYGDCVAGEKREELALDKAIGIVKRGGLDES